MMRCAKAIILISVALPVAGAMPIAFARNPDVAPVTDRSPDSSESATFEPIRSASDLHRHMQMVPRSQSPLGRLSDTSLRRFIAALKFGSKGVSSFSTPELENELTDSQIGELLSLFDLDDSAGALRGAAISRQTGSSSERWPELGTDAMGEWERREASLRDYASDPPAVLTKRYEELFGEFRGRPLTGVATDELRAYFNAAHFTYFESGSSTSLADMRAALVALDAVGAVRKTDLEAMYRSLLADRRLDEAGDFLQSHPQASGSELPQIEAVESSENHPAVLRVEGDTGNRWRREVVDHGSSPRILVAAGLGCRFSHDAFEALQQHATLGPIFARHALVLFDHRSPLEADSYRRWQTRYPHFTASVAWQASDWPLLDSTPTFYFLRSGKIVETVTGWPDDETIAEIQAALHRIGVITPPAAAP